MDGSSYDITGGTVEGQSISDTIQGIFESLVPANITEAAATPDVLSVIMFAIFFGVMASKLVRTSRLHMKQEVLCNAHLLCIYTHTHTTRIHKKNGTQTQRNGTQLDITRHKPNTTQASTTT